MDRLWIQQVDQKVSRALPGTEGAYAPFWAPDGGEVGFFADGKLRRIDVASGYVQVVADAPSGRGGAWNADGVIVFAPIATGGLVRVPAAGGTPVALIDGGPGIGTPRWPQFLPDGRRFLFYRSALAQPELRGVYVASLDGGEPARVMDAFGPAGFVPPHWLFFELYGSLRAQRFDASRAVLSGDPIKVEEDIAFDGGIFRDSFSPSPIGAFAYRRRNRHPRSQLTWRDRTGNVTGTLGSPEDLSIAAPAISPDGTRVAVARRVQGSDNMWLFDATGGMPTRVTVDPIGSNQQVISDRQPVWSPDSTRIVLASARKVGSATTDLYEHVIGSGLDRLLLMTSDFKYPYSWSRDGRFLLYVTSTASTALDIWALPVDRAGKPFPVAQSKFNEDFGQLSPDGQWVAYQSNESGRFEILVQSFPDPTVRMRVSTSGGIQPRWAHDGAELFYIAPGGEMMTTPIAIRAHERSLTPGRPVALFAARLARDGTSLAREIPQYDVAPDGRFLLVNPTDEVAPPSISVILNWNGESVP